MPEFLDTLKNLFNPPLTWRISGNSATGAAREQNEDSIGFAQDDNGAIAILADGVGGYKAGEVASRYLCAELESWFAARPKALNSNEAERQLKEAITAVHDRLYQKSRDETEQKGMATTLAVVLQYRHCAIVAWAGDSRIYLLRGDTLTQLSEDHSVVQEKIRRGELTQAEAENHPMSNLITSTIGGKPRISHLGLITVPLEKRDSLLLVSDGISGVLPPKKLRKLLPKGVDALIASAQRAHSLDDCSAVIVSVK
jgi:PPM family protein phosphatase